MIQVPRKQDPRRSRWYLDSGCSRHMTWDVNNFVSLSRKIDGGTVTFGDDSKGKIICNDNIQIGKSPLIEDVALVDGLKHNLLSISQLCDKDFCVAFYSSCCKVF